MAPHRVRIMATETRDASPARRERPVFMGGGGALCVILRGMRRIVMTLALAAAAAAVRGATFRAADYGIAPGRAFRAEDVARLLADARRAAGPKTIVFGPGVYDVGPGQCQRRTWFLSNHDQQNPRQVFLPLEGMRDLRVEARGATLNLRGRIIAAGVWDSARVTLEGLTVDYEVPPLTQVTFTAVDPEARTVTFALPPGARPSLEGTRLFFEGPDFRESPGMGILFEADGRIAYRTADVGFDLGQVSRNADGTFTAAACAHRAFRPGQRMALRSWGRTAPGIVLSDSRDVTIRDVTIHYADGMGVLGQNTEGITLERVRVTPNRAKGRLFSTQADATHFSGCSGLIRCEAGEFEGMMDDAINIHGTYLRVERRVDARTLACAYAHGQSYGMAWGAAGEAVAFVRARTMERVAGADNVLERVMPLDAETVRAGAKRLLLTFRDPLPPEIDPAREPLGAENLTRTPRVDFIGNRVADNRARGALFSTPRAVRCLNNLFDHTSGSAILLCGDCNGWYESGACADVLIQGNVFVNALTSPYQFTEAVISVCPEIPDLAAQRRRFHSGIRIVGNTFVAFDAPLVFAKSVAGLTVAGNRLVRSTDYAPYHRNTDWLTLRACDDVRAEPPTEAP